ncbi:beta-lactamase-like protein [Diaporthe sp. PMI_573]|nr:beta-lactamase-like protein [Diaporthaceae sp. PMI_573]
MATQPTIHDVFESKTGTWQYVVSDPVTSRAAIIDPVLDFEPSNQTLTTGSADALLSLVKDKGYKVDLILETHAHADHVTAGSYLQSRLSQMQGYKPPIGIGKRISRIQDFFSKKYGVPADEVEGVFERLFDDDEVFEIGTLKAKAIHLPGHTPDHLGYMIGDNVFCGDSIFHADIGTARCDFPGGDAKDLYKSGRKLLSLPDHVKVWTGHDYPSQGRKPTPYMTVEEHKKQNKHLRDGITEQDFVAMRTQRDQAMAAPRLIHPSLQMNIRSGRLPKPTPSGQQMLHLPLNIQEHAQW